MSKKTMISLVLCLAFCASLFALPAFADSTVIVIGGPVGQTQSGSIAAQSPLNSISGINSSGTVIVAGGGNAPVQSTASADTTSLASVIVMPNGTVVSPQSAQSKQAAAAPATATQTTPRAASAVPAGLAGQIYQRINDYRSANGLGVLGYDAQLQGTADVRAKESASSFGHTRPDGSAAVTAVTVDYTVAGENLIQVTKELASVDIIVETWLASPTHKANIVLGDFSQTAIGIYESNGTLFISQIFTD